MITLAPFGLTGPTSGPVVRSYSFREECSDRDLRSARIADRFHGWSPNAPAIPACLRRAATILALAMVFTASGIVKACQFMALFWCRI